MNTVRDIQPQDLGWVMSLATEFNDKFGLPPINYTRAKRTLTDVINLGVALRTDNAAIIGILVPDPFRDAVHLAELGWYSKDKSGLKLLEAFHECGKELLCDEIRMTTLHNSPPGASRILQRMGYTPTEHGWSLQL